MALGSWCTGVASTLISVLILTKYGLQAEAISSPGMDFLPENKVICQGQRLKLHCTNSSMGLKIYSALYGRTERGHVICPYIGAKDDATYNCGEDDVTERLRQICEKRNRCRIKVNSALFGDPCPDKHLYLNLVYSCELVKRKHKIITLSSSSNPMTATSDDMASAPTESLLSFSTIGRFPALNMTSPSASSNHILMTNAVPRTHEPSAVYATSTIHVLNTNTSDMENTINPHLVEQASSAEHNGVGSLGILGALLVWVMFMEDHSPDYTTVFCVSAAAALGLSLLVGFYLVYRYTGKKQQQHVKDKEEPKQSMNGPTERSPLNELDPHVLGPIKTPPPDYILEEINWDRGGTLPHKNSHEAMMLRTYSDRDVYPRDRDLNGDRRPEAPQYPGSEAAVIVQRPDGSSMYLNPMYAKGRARQGPL